MIEPNREEMVFAAALRLPPPERAAYLDRATGHDPVLRSRVESLLISYEAGDYLEASAAPNPQTIVVAPPPITEKPGDRIGRYKLLQEIGEGGCGIVYMAEQDEPVRRRVALKIIKLGMDTRSVIARFEAERQALAMMDHPNIAKILDGGATDTGRPYFVMELVRGRRITEYCDQSRLPIRARLDLFTQVCHAVQHAHQKGVIHRDLKPSNILVTVNDGVAVPKIIDFGIAKATNGQQLTDKTLFTAFEQFIGTPAYMSPEQAILTSVDVDTRSDIYALGVLLYELLTGKTPFDPRELLAIGFDEMRRTIREKEPPAPSTRLSDMPDDELSTTAHRRNLQPPRLTTEIQGDLDWIVMKCLEKDRARRYETANELASEIDRHLNDEPVSARPPSASYRLRKAVYRNKGPVAAAALVFFALLLGFTASLWQAIRATRAENVANSERANALAEKKRADEQAAEAKAINDFLREDLLGQASTAIQSERGFSVIPSITLREATDRAFKRVNPRFKDRPLIEAAILDTIAITYNDLLEFNLALQANERALALRKANLPPDNAEVLHTMGIQAIICLNVGKDRYDQAESLTKDALAISTRKFGADHLEAVGDAFRLGLVLTTIKKWNEGATILERILPIEEKKLGPDAQRTFATITLLAECYAETGQYEDAIKLDEKAMERATRAFGTNHPSFLDCKTAVGGHFMVANRPREGAAFLAENYRYGLNTFGPKSVSTDSARINLFDRLGKLDEPARHQALEGARQILTGDPRLLFMRGNLFAAAGHWEESTIDLRNYLAAYPDDHEAWHQMAANLIQTHDLAGYRDHCRRSVDKFYNSTDPHSLHRIAKDALILPDSGVDLNRLSSMAQRCLAAGTNNSAHVVAMSEYRLGRFASALEWARKKAWCGWSTPCNGGVELEVRVISAMAREKLNDHETALAELAECEQYEKAYLPRPESDWLDGVFGRAMLQEARALIGGGASKAQANAK